MTDQEQIAELERENKELRERIEALERSEFGYIRTPAPSPFGVCICSYDCSHCPFSSCVMPIPYDVR